MIPADSGDVGVNLSIALPCLLVFRIDSCGVNQNRPTDMAACRSLHDGKRRLNSGIMNHRVGACQCLIQKLRTHKFPDEDFDVGEHLLQIICAGGGPYESTDPPGKAARISVLCE